MGYVRDTGHKTANGVNSSAASFASLPAAGNSIIILVTCWNIAIAAAEVTDNQSNTYARDAYIGPNQPASPQAATCGIFSDIEIGSPSGTFTITINPGNATDYFEWVGVEFSGLLDASALDITATNAGTDNSPLVSGGTTNQNDELWVGVCALTDELTDIGFDFPAGWTQLGNLVQDAATTIAFLSGYKIVSSTGTLAFDGGTTAYTATLANGWVIAAAAYKAVVAAADNAPYIPQLYQQAVARGAFF